MTIAPLNFTQDDKTNTTFSADLKVGSHTLTFISDWDNNDGEGWEFSCQVNVDKDGVWTFDRLTDSSESGCVEFMMEYFEREGVDFGHKLNRADIKVILSSLDKIAKQTYPASTTASENYYGV